MKDRRKPKKRVYADWWYERHQQLEDERKPEVEVGGSTIFLATVFLLAMAMGAMVSWILALAFP